MDLVVTPRGGGVGVGLNEGLWNMMEDDPDAVFGRSFLGEVLSMLMGVDRRWAG